jgi:hypothetical protein
VRIGLPQLLPKGLFKIELSGSFEARLSTLGKPTITAQSMIDYVAGTIGLATSFGPKDSPWIDLSGDVEFVYPCLRGDQLHISAHANINMGPLQMKDLAAGLYRWNAADP